MIEFFTIFYELFYKACFIVSNVLLVMYFILLILTIKKRVKEQKEFIQNDFVYTKLNYLLLCSYFISFIESVINPNQGDGYIFSIVIYLTFSILFYFVNSYQIKNYKNKNEEVLSKFIEKYKDYLHLN